MTSTDPTVVVFADTARDMLAVLELVEDWLLHTSDDVACDFAAFAFPCHTEQQQEEAVTELIDVLGGHSVTLRRKLRRLQPTP
ncbi:MAG: hypothetical protein ACRDQA_01265 [Nocardioidaceae bacterium]